MSEVCLCGQTEPTQGWPCTHGGCHFVDPEKIKTLDLWIAAAESVRSTCDNIEEFDALIAAQKKRLADLWWSDEPEKLIRDKLFS